MTLKKSYCENCANAVNNCCEAYNDCEDASEFVPKIKEAPSCNTTTDDNANQC